jgi:predicted nucleic acid-binding protein
MIVLDTNVVSEMLKPAPSDAIVHRLASQQSSSVFTTVITRAEILYGIEVLPAGKRKHGLLSLLGSSSTNFSLEGYFPLIRKLRSNMRKSLAIASLFGI